MVNVSCIPCQPQQTLSSGVLLELQLIANQVLQRLGVNRTLQLASPDFLNVAGHITLDGLEGSASKDIKESSHGFGGFKEFEGGNGMVVFDGDIFETLLAVKVCA